MLTKTQLIVFVCAMSAIALSSCDKCFTCVVKDQDNVVRFEYPEQCGSKKEINAYTEECESAYGSFGFTCQCGESL